MSIDSFEHEKKVTRLKHDITIATTEWDNLRSTAGSIAEFKDVKINKLADLDIKRTTYRIDFKYSENEILVGIDDQLRSLNKLIENLSKEVIGRTPDSEVLGSQQAVLRTLRRKAEETSNSIETIMLSISEVDSKLSTLNHDYDQYQQLKRLKKVGSDISSNIDTRKCPICENNLYDTLRSSTAKREPMTIDENIDFLKNQMDFFGAIKKRSATQLKELQENGILLHSQIDAQTVKLSHLREDIDDIHGTVRSILREKIETEISLKEVLKLKETQDDLNKQINVILSKWVTAMNSLKQLRKGSSVKGKESVIRKFESIIKRNLKAFNFKHSAINSVTISRQTLRPEQEGYDIVAETSASDYIRLIWAYTLALLELAGKDDEQKIKHSGFVVFDEPRQHEANMISFTGLIGKSSESGSYGGQVIFATSLNESEVRRSCANKDVNLICFDDYILSLEMDIETMKKMIADKLSSTDEIVNWIDLLQDTNPGHYGIEDLDVTIDPVEISINDSVNIFTFENAQLTFLARMGASSDEHGYDDNFSVTVSGSGTLQLINQNTDLNISDLFISDSVNLYDE